MLFKCYLNFLHSVNIFTSNNGKAILKIRNYFSLLSECIKFHILFVFTWSLKKVVIILHYIHRLHRKTRSKILIRVECPSSYYISYVSHLHKIILFAKTVFLILTKGILNHDKIHIVLNFKRSLLNFIIILSLVSTLIAEVLLFIDWISHFLRHWRQRYTFR